MGVPGWHTLHVQRGFLACLPEVVSGAAAGIVRGDRVAPNGNCQPRVLHRTAVVAATRQHDDVWGVPRARLRCLVHAEPTIVPGVHHLIASDLIELVALEESLNFSTCDFPLLVIEVQSDP